MFEGLGALSLSFTKKGGAARGNPGCSSGLAATGLPAFSAPSQAQCNLGELRRRRHDGRGLGLALAALLVVTALPAQAQQAYPLGPLPPASAPSAEPLPPISAPPPEPLPRSSPAAAAGADSAAPQTGRVFCDQTVSFRVADPEAAPRRYRGFLGIWSDASWDARTCAALIVENVQSDGTATITYVYGPNGSTSHVPAAVLHGTGVIRDGALLFQNSDGTQYAFRPMLADLDGRLTTPRGQVYEAVFKKTP